MGIFDSGAVWASSIHQLNDSSEFKHALELAKSEIAKVIAESNERYPAALGLQLVDLLNRSSRLSVYVACFSEAGDSLSQWRGYCPDAFGYSIGFDEEHLRNVAIAQGFTLSQCIYDVSKQRALISDWAQTTVADLAPYFDTLGSSHSFDTAAWPRLESLLLLAPFLKHQSFAEEREWRMARVVNLNDVALKLRPGKSMLIRYLEVRLSLSPTSEIVWNVCVGPTPHPELAADGVSHYLGKVKIRNGIGYSNSPYRSW